MKMGTDWPVNSPMRSLSREVESFSVFRSGCRLSVSRHFVHAIASRIKQAQPNRTRAYLPAATFFSLRISASRARALAASAS